jgi:hypothetical protein
VFGRVVDLHGNHSPFPLYFLKFPRYNNFFLEPTLYIIYNAEIWLKAIFRFKHPLVWRTRGGPSPSTPARCPHLRVQRGLHRPALGFLSTRALASSGCTRCCEAPFHTCICLHILGLRRLIFVRNKFARAEDFGNLHIGLPILVPHRRVWHAWTLDAPGGPWVLS